MPQTLVSNQSNHWIGSGFLPANIWGVTSSTARSSLQPLKGKQELVIICHYDQLYKLEVVHSHNFLASLCCWFCSLCWWDIARPPEEESSCDRPASHMWPWTALADGLELHRYKLLPVMAASYASQSVFKWRVGANLSCPFFGHSQFIYRHFLASKCNTASPMAQPCWS